MNDLYERLATHLDALPAGFPRTPGGAEMRILARLFSPADVEIALKLTLIAEEPRIIARRTGLSVAEAAERLADMERRGLIFGEHRAGRPPRYMIFQFAVGFWEGQVNRLDPDLVRDFEEYLPTFATPERWRKTPQLRTIPIGESIPLSAEALPYERAEEIVGRHQHIAVANCICRQELAVLGHGCGRLPEACLSFDAAAEHYVRSGRGRAITQAEARRILRDADRDALVLQPSNSKAAASICACCGCCCGGSALVARRSATGSPDQQCVPCGARQRGLRRVRRVRRTLPDGRAVPG